MSSLFEHATPSIVATDLALMTRRLRKHTGLDLVPMVVVEGPNDETLLGPLCVAGSKHVFAAGTRALVEQLLLYLRNDPVPGCTCVFVTDCDGRGKAVFLKDEPTLVVTENCDIEADLVALGVVEEVLGTLIGDSARAKDIVTEATALAMPVSRVRRAAAQVSVSFKRGGQRRLALLEIDATVLRAGRGVGLQPRDVLAAVQTALGWSAADSESVGQQLPAIPNEFRLTCSGKDVLDAAWFLLREDGHPGDFSAEVLHRRVRTGLQPRHLQEWEVGRRLREWQANTCSELLRAELP